MSFSPQVELGLEFFSIVWGLIIPSAKVVEPSGPDLQYSGPFPIGSVPMEWPCPLNQVRFVNTDIAQGPLS